MFKCLFKKQKVNSDIVYPSNLPTDFDKKLNKRIILAGSGLSIPFGGLLIQDFKQRLFNKYPSGDLIRDYLNNDNNFEIVLDKLNDFKQNQLFVQNLMQIYDEMDSKILSDSKTNGSRLIELVNAVFLKDKYNLFFTLNQDLLLEYVLYHHRENIKCFQNINNGQQILPFWYPYCSRQIQRFIQYSPSDKKIILTGLDYPRKEMLDTPVFSEKSLLKTNLLNYIKLHGSIHWEHPDGTPLLVTGGKKINQINTFVIFKIYHEIFQKVLLHKNLDIIVIGYGFKDPHINNAIYHSIKYSENNNQLHIITVGDNKQLLTNIPLIDDQNNIYSSNKTDVIFNKHVGRYWDKGIQEFLDENQNSQEAKYWNNLRGNE